MNWPVEPIDPSMNASTSKDPKDVFGGCPINWECAIKCDYCLIYIYATDE